MKRVQRVLVTAVAVSAVVAGAVGAGPAAGAEDGRDGLRERLDGLVAEGAVGALIEVRDRRGVWRAGSGAAALGTTRPVPAHGRFRIASITKTFLATVILQLVDEGRLRLDDPVDARLPGAVPGGDRITVRHLLNHTGGLPDYRTTLPLPPDPAFLAGRWRTWTPAELLERALAAPPAPDPPGTVFAYTNTGYLLLGQIVEKATGRPYAEEIEKRIIRPLKLRATTLPGSDPRVRGPHPRGYVPIAQDGGQPRLADVTEMNPSLLGAGGEMISTARDLNTFLGALLGGRLLPERLLAEMREPAVEGRRYGLGLAWKDTACGIRVYGNDGDAMAYQSWTFATADRSRRVTLALTPDHRADLDDSVDALLDEAFCDRG